MIYLSVREVAEKFSKSEETVKRWLRGGKFPNAFKATDKEGWKIPLSDLTEQALSVPQPEQTSLDFQSPQSHPHERNFVLLSEIHLISSVIMCRLIIAFWKMYFHVGIFRNGRGN